MTLRERARKVHEELRAIGVALGDPRTPTHAKVIAGLTLGLAASPIDPIPDFVPVLGYVDDAIFVPAGLYLARRSIPENVLAEARETRDHDPGTRSQRLLGAVIVVLWWATAATVAASAIVYLHGTVG